MLLINVYHGGQILKTSTGVSYNICIACTFSVDKIINIHDLKRQIHVGLKLLSSHFNITISAWINTAPSSLSVFYSLFGVISQEIWGMVKTIVSYQIPGYKTQELVVESELIFSSDYYNLTTISESSNPVMADEITQSRARE
jgi:hypothetical protein